MADWGDVGSTLGLAAGFVGAAVSWVAGLGIITILISVGLGSLLTYLVQTRTQKSAWKRESGLRKVDEIYGPLYNELNRISDNVSPDKSLLGYQTYWDGLADSSWSKIKVGYQYYLIDPELRKELDGFFNELKHYSDEKRKLYSIVDGKLLPHLRKAFGRDVEGATYQVSAIQQNGMPINMAGQTLHEPILAGESPVAFTARQNQQFSDYKLELYLQRAGVSPLFFGRSKPDAATEKQFQELYDETTKEVKEDPTVKWIKEATKELNSRSQTLKEKVRLKIEEPWRL